MRLAIIAENSPNNDSDHHHASLSMLLSILCTKHRHIWYLRMHPATWHLQPTSNHEAKVQHSYDMTNSTDKLCPKFIQINMPSNSIPQHLFNWRFVYQPHRWGYGLAAAERDVYPSRRNGGQTSAIGTSAMARRCLLPWSEKPIASSGANEIGSFDCRQL